MMTPTMSPPGGQTIGVQGLPRYNRYRVIARRGTTRLDCNVTNYEFGLCYDNYLRNDENILGDANDLGSYKNGLGYDNDLRNSENALSDNTHDENAM